MNQHATPPKDVTHQTRSLIRAQERLDDDHRRAVASWWYSGQSSALYSYASTGLLTLHSNDYLDEIRAACRYAPTYGECADDEHGGLAVLYSHIAENVPDLDGYTKPRITMQDVRNDTRRYWDHGPDRWHMFQTRCEHDYYLTDSCPGCDRVQEMAEDFTPAQEEAYWKIVAHQGAHHCPDRLSFPAVRALARRGLVDLHRKITGRGWTATPGAFTVTVPGYTRVENP